MADSTISTRIAEAFHQLTEQEAVKKGLSFIEQDHAQTIADQIALTEIPAPPFKRAAAGRRFYAEIAGIGA
ncbi:hypothetical protein FK545_13620 [Planococcus glaciei]|nr:hypothetical protein [Planococcus glaciei]QDY46068.1 hypothetical protein FK545_13620 [Planococcus glaciei]